MPHSVRGRKNCRENHFIGYSVFSINRRRQVMTQERLSLHKIREVLRLKHEVGLSNQAIARACHIFQQYGGEICQASQTSRAGLAGGRGSQRRRTLPTVFSRRRKGNDHRTSRAGLGRDASGALVVTRCEP